MQFTSPSGDRPGADNVIILMTDGFSDVMEGETPEALAAEELKETGVSIYTIAVSDNSNLIELHNINSDPDDEYLFSVGADGDYTATAGQILDQLCQ